MEPEIDASHRRPRCWLSELFARALDGEGEARVALLELAVWCQRARDAVIALLQAEVERLEVDGELDALPPAAEDQLLAAMRVARLEFDARRDSYRAAGSVASSTRPAVDETVAFALKAAQAENPEESPPAARPGGPRGT